MEIFENISNVVIEGEKEKLAEVINEALEKGIEPIEIIQNGLTPGLKTVGDKFENMELYLPEMMLSADVMKAGLDFLKPHIKDTPIHREGVFVIGTIQGDVHDIGKNIVSTFLEVSGFEVYDLGCDIPPHVFIERAEEKRADIIGISALLTSTMTYIPDVIEELKSRELRDKYVVMVGGAPLSPDWARDIGADGYGKDFLESVNVAKQLMQVRRSMID
jgi:5-methyltetrahydrofolate--homocysteine methyltransferase